MLGGKSFAEIAKKFFPMRRAVRRKSTAEPAP
jgi:hypothetical protein